MHVGARAHARAHTHTLTYVKLYFVHAFSLDLLYDYCVKKTGTVKRF